MLLKFTRNLPFGQSLVVEFTWGKRGNSHMFRTAFLLMSLAMLGGGALAAKSAIDIQYSVALDPPPYSYDGESTLLAAR